MQDQLRRDPICAAGDDGKAKPAAVCPRRPSFKASGQPFQHLRRHDGAVIGDAERAVAAKTCFDWTLRRAVAQGVLDDVAEGLEQQAVVSAQQRQIVGELQPDALGALRLVDAGGHFAGDLFQ